MKATSWILIGVAACGSSGGSTSGSNGSGASVTASAGASSTGAATGVTATATAAATGASSAAAGSTGTTIGTAGSSGNSSSGSSGDPTGYTVGTCTPDAGFAGNSLGIGGYCSAGGKQCGNYTSTLTLSCSADLPGGSGNFCIALAQCMQDSDCGTAACCATQEGFKVCLPVNCASGSNTGATTCPTGM